MHMTSHIQYININQYYTSREQLTRCSLTLVVCNVINIAVACLRKPLIIKLKKKGIKENKMNNKKRKTVMRQTNIDN